ncbi:MAG TPA: NADH-quinone oxidoreductase subunit C [Anaeromyxobacteraceae bacterium]|jgi:NADH-quinone oxidoreductase subunit C|nr:NADH-quinone oxidoreductase subunit C [Anaeromyxobacteraceae bacterium]
MTTNEIHEKLKARFGDAVGPLSEPKIDPFVVVQAAKLPEIARFLRDEPGLGLDFLENLSGVDYPKRNVIEVVYHLFSYGLKHGIVLKVEADRAGPRVPSVEAVWKSANWMEREAYDLLGVIFEGHPDLRRVLLPDDWEGYPLRKDYQEHGGYHGISNVRENPLVELRRLDEVARAEELKRNPPPPPPPPAAAAPAAPTTPPAPQTPPAGA